jgi:hypothetical protein
LWPCWATTVTIGTASGNTVSTSYYTQDGNSAAGTATVNGGSLDVSTSGYVHKGLIMAKTAAGWYQFSPFSGSPLF